MKRFYTLLAIIIVLTLPGITKAQNTFPSSGSSGIGTATPDASSILEVKSTTKGMLIPRMSKIQRDAIAAPAIGLMIYQTNSTPGFYYYDGSTWKQVTPASVNKSLSNLSGPTAVNVDLRPDTSGYLNLGAVDAPWGDLFLKKSIFLNGLKFISAPGSYNIFVGESCGSSIASGSGNTGIGPSALYSNTSGSFSTATGEGTLNSNTSGNWNSAFGSGAMGKNTVGISNAAVGFQALQLNTSGNANSALGANSLQQNTTGYSNTATGAASLYANSTGYQNTGNGTSALYSNTTGDYNSALGYDALYLNTTGYNNTAVGKNALYSAKISNYNTACGADALYSNTASYNTANGYGALYSNTSADQNTAIGYEALYLNTTGSKNTTIGAYTMLDNTSGTLNAVGGLYALLSNQTGSENTAFGASAGSNAIANNYCSFFGYDADQALNTNYTNSTAIGSTSRITANNQVRIGSSYVTSIGGYADWSNISDGRFKRNLKENVPGLAFINKLKPVTYNLDITSLRKFVGEDVSYDKDRKKLSSEADEKTKQSIQKKEMQIQTGFVAQDVEKAAKELGYDFSGVDIPENESSAYGLRYSEFVVPLVKAVQELSKQNNDLKKGNEELKARLDKIEALISANTSLPERNNAHSSKNNLATASLDAGVALQQNIPNPFLGTTTINYTLPSSYSSAQIIITDQTGKTLNRINLNGSGKGSMSINASALSTGMYNYSLVVNGKTVDAKRMILAK